MKYKIEDLERLDIKYVTQLMFSLTNKQDAKVFMKYFENRLKSDSSKEEKNALVKKWIVSKIHSLDIQTRRRIRRIFEIRI